MVPTNRLDQAAQNDSDRDTILVVDDDELMLSTLADAFGQKYNVITAQSGPEAISCVRESTDILCVVMDIKMPNMDGITAARAVRELNPDIPVIFYTGYPGEYNETNVDRSENFYDCVVKGEAFKVLARSARNAVESCKLRKENELFSEYLESQFGIIGKSFPMREICRQIRNAARSKSTVMILGESGTGKELVAQAIHAHSNRCKARFARLNCNHKNPGQIESELFGHCRGAFSNVLDRIGKFEYANGGTLFLDEIGDLDITTQAKILQVLETGEMEKIGDPNPRNVDVRVLCATHRNLKQMVDDEAFRFDLYYRLKGIVIELPPLRDRKEDIPALIDKFVERHASGDGMSVKVFDQGALNYMLEYGWPGNVRQLMKTVESALDMVESDLIMREDVVPILESKQTAGKFADGRLIDRMRDYERTLIIQALTEARGNITQAAQILGIERSNLHKKIDSHRINVSAIKNPD